MNIANKKTKWSKWNRVRLCSETHGATATRNSKNDKRRTSTGAATKWDGSECRVLGQVRRVSKERTTGMMWPRPGRNEGRKDSCPGAQCVQVAPYMGPVDQILRSRLTRSVRNGWMQEWDGLTVEKRKWKCRKRREGERKSSRKSGSPEEGDRRERRWVVTVKQSRTERGGWVVTSTRGNETWFGGSKNPTEEECKEEKMKRRE